MSTYVYDNPAMRSGRRAKGLTLLAAYVALYAATLFAMVRFGRFDASDALGVFAVLGAAPLRILPAAGNQSRTENHLRQDYVSLSASS